tara:strand:+ start:77 stop:337 length:261 start_codon:yes stop_codon:yes gene_type:complete
MGEVKRYIVRTNEIGISAGFERSHGPWVSYQDHAEAIARLMQHSATRERMNGQTIATLRAEVERRVKEIAHLKLARWPKKAERNRI